MSTTFQWLNELMQWLGRWVPRLTLIRVTHRGVRFGLGGRVAEVPPGLCWYWPITSELEMVCVAERSSQIAAQLIGHRIAAVAVVWQVANAVVALTTYRNVAARLDDSAQTALVRCGGDLAGVHTALTEEFHGVLRILRVGSIHDGWCVPVKLFKDWAVHESSDVG